MKQPSENIATGPEGMCRWLKIREPRRRPGHTPVLVADCTRFQKAIRRSPQRSDLQTIMETARRWAAKFSPARACS